MFRRHLSSIIYIALIIVIGALYGVLLGVIGLPLWAAICMSLGFGVLISVLGDTISRAVIRWYDERQSVKAYEKEHGR